MCDHPEVPATVLASDVALLGRRTLLAGLAGTGLVWASGGVAAARPDDLSGLVAAPDSQNGWSTIAAGSSAFLDRGFVVAGVGFPGGIRRGQAGTILRYVATRMHAEVEPLRSGWCWGWSYRRIRGGSQYSNHASATALDLNAPRHPLGRRGTFSTAQVRRIHAIIDACDGVVRWGGDYRGRKDEMHFEINVRPTDPRVARLAARITAGTPAPAPVPVVTPAAATGWPTVRTGADSFRVRVIQRLLTHAGFRVEVTGYFGSKTKRAAVAFQRRHDLPAYGIVGPMTWPQLVVPVRPGARGQHVRGAQTALRAAGAELRVDGVAGAKTRAAVVAYQQRMRLTASGTVDGATWARLV